MRDQRYDIVKGMAIVLMVVGHAGFGKYIGNFIYLFHMSVFFICAGLLYHTQKESFDDVLKFIWKKARRLWWPFVLWGGIGILTWNMCFSIYIYSDNPMLNNRWVFEPTDVAILPKRLFNVLLMRDGKCGMMGTFWFLRSMFFALCGYRVINYILNRFRVCNLLAQSIVSMVFLVICTQQMPQAVAYAVQFFGGRPTLLAYVLIHIGILLRTLRMDLSRISKYYQSIIFIACIFMLTIMSHFESIEIGAAKYNHPVSMLACSLCGWFGLLSLARFIPWGGVWAYLGVHSMPIMIFHFLAFKIVSTIGVLLRGDELFMIASFPVLYKGFWWSMAYTLVGVLVPLFLNTLWWRFYDWIRHKYYLVADACQDCV